MNTKADPQAQPQAVLSSAELGPPLEDSLKRAYYYTESGEWRGPEASEWDRWHAVAKVAAAQFEAERERCTHPLRRLGARLAALLDEDQWAECEALLLEAGVQPNSN